MAGFTVLVLPAERKEDPVDYGAIAVLILAWAVIAALITWAFSLISPRKGA